MLIIRPIHPDEIPAARHVILSVAYNIYGWERGLEEMTRHFESTGEFEDMAHVEEHYFQNDGLFLVVLDDDKVIGSGAVRKFDEETAELKRLWLLETHHGKGIGYRVINQLFEFARSKGYKRVILQTSPRQIRAIAFYQRLGFQEIESYNGKTGEISMALQLG
jgi:putative acetyltransferase